MNIYPHFVNKKLRFSALLLVMIPLIFSCKSTDPTDAGDQGSEFYAVRPKIILETPVTILPYTLKWEGSNAVRSYEIQSATDPEFTQSRQSWTTKESSLLITELKGNPVYFRVRANFGSEYSRWSEVLEVSGTSDEIRLNRLRS